MSIPRFQKSSEDKKANSFAQELLMPEREFLAAVEFYGYDVDKLVVHFGVPSLAVRIRGASFGFRECYDDDVDSPSRGFVCGPVLAPCQHHFVFF
ncbi:MAG: ImmA/IrrE family metallo-endopeptidase [Thermoguttaceae bacterium]